MHLKGQYIYQDIWTSKPGEQFKIFMEPDNPKEKFAVCANKNKIYCGTFKERYHWKISKDNLFLPGK